jgi:hypothetical protein
MRRALLFVLPCVFSLVFNSCKNRAWENQDWITEYGWSMEMDLRSPHHYDWHWYKIPHATINKVLIPPGSTIYRCRFQNSWFYYYYQLDSEHVFELGRDKDGDGKDDELGIEWRKNNNYFAISNPKGKSSMERFIQGKERTGGRRLNRHPLVGIWDSVPFLLEFRLAKPANYIYFMEIDKDIPSFAIRRGTYLLKQVEDTVFESDSCFPDGHIRLEIQDKETLVLKPLFELPEYEGLLEPLLLKSFSKESQYSFQELFDDFYDMPDL